MGTCHRVSAPNFGSNGTRLLTQRRGLTIHRSRFDLRGDESEEEEEDEDGLVVTSCGNVAGIWIDLLLLLLLLLLLSCVIFFRKKK